MAKKEEKIEIKKSIEDDKLLTYINVFDKTVENLYSLGKLPYDSIAVLYSIRIRKDQLTKDTKIMKGKYKEDEFNTKPNQKRIVTKLTLPELISSYIELIKEGHAKGGIPYETAIQLKTIEMEIKKDLVA